MWQASSRPLAWARRASDFMVSPSTSRRSNVACSSSSLPASILEKSRMSLMIVNSDSAESRTIGQVVALAVGQRRVEHQFGHADDGVHRRADLVAHVGQEIALGPVGRLGLLMATCNCASARLSSVMSREMPNVPRISPSGPYSGTLLVNIQVTRPSGWSWSCSLPTLIVPVRMISCSSARYCLARAASKKSSSDLPIGLRRVRQAKVLRQRLADAEEPAVHRP